MAEKYVNDFASTISDGGDGIDASQTTIGLASVTGLPTSGALRFKCESEIIKATGVSGSNLTGCSRGQEGTTAATHAEGTAITQILTAGAIDQIKLDVASGIIVTDAFASRPTAGTEGKLFLPSDTPAGPSRDTGSAWGEWFGIRKVTPPVSGDWSWDYQGTGVTVDTGYNMQYLYCPISQEGWRIKTLGGSKTKVEAFLSGIVHAGNYARFTLGVRVNSSGKTTLFGPCNITSARRLEALRFNTRTYSSTPYAQDWQSWGMLGLIGIRIEDDGVNVNFFLSPDLVHWVQVYTETRAAHLAAMFDRVIFQIGTNGSYPQGASMVHYAEYA